MCIRVVRGVKRVLRKVLGAKATPAFPLQPDGFEQGLGERACEGAHAQREDMRPSPAPAVPQTSHVDAAPVFSAQSEAFDPALLHVRITRRAWTAILAETLAEIRTETGGILLGYRDGNDWLVVESIDPGPGSVMESAYFEYNEQYVTHLANRIAKMYQRRLEILGLWHRHPGSFDRFSNTDDGTNATFAQMSPLGALSGLVNVDPTPRFTLYHVSFPLAYDTVPFTVVSDEEAAACAPLRSAEELERIIERRNAGRSPYRVQEGARSALSPARAAELVGRGVPRDSELCSRIATGAGKAWDDEGLERLLQLVEEDEVLLSAYGLGWGMRIATDGGLTIVARSGSDEEELGTIVPGEQGGETAPVFVAARGGACCRYGEGVIGRALKAAACM